MTGHTPAVMTGTPIVIADKPAGFRDLCLAVEKGTKQLPPASAPETDAALCELWGRHQDNRRTMALLSDKHDACDVKQEPDRYGAMQDQYDALVEFECSIEDEIILTPADGLVGMFVKLLACVQNLDVRPECSEKRDTQAIDAVMQVERLLGGGVAADDKADEAAS
jgi:hypothetical protein